MPDRPDLRGNLKPPTLDLFWLFRFRVPRTGHDFLSDDTPLNPQSEAHVATIFLYKLAPDQFFRQRRSARVERVATHAWEDGRRRVCVVRRRPSEPWIGIGLHRIPVPMLLMCGMYDSHCIARPMRESASFSGNSINEFKAGSGRVGFSAVHFRP